MLVELSPWVNGDSGHERIVRLCGEWYGSRSGERPRQPGEHGEVGVKRDLRQATDAERAERVFVLQASELALDGGAGPA